jgi:hypothetical protein
MGGGRQRGGGVDWAATVSTSGRCSLLRMTDKQRGDERGKGYGMVECREGVGAFIVLEREESRRVTMAGGAN